MHIVMAILAISTGVLLAEDQATPKNPATAAANGAIVNPSNAGDGKPPHLRPRRAPAAQHAAGDQAEDHRAERWDEA